MLQISNSDHAKNVLEIHNQLRTKGKKKQNRSRQPANKRVYPASKGSKRYSRPGRWFRQVQGRINGAAAWAGSETGRRGGKRREATTRRCGTGNGEQLQQEKGRKGMGGLVCWGAREWRRSPICHTVVGRGQYDRRLCRGSSAPPSNSVPTTLLGHATVWGSSNLLSSIQLLFDNCRRGKFMKNSNVY